MTDEPTIATTTTPRRATGARWLLPVLIVAIGAACTAGGDTSNTNNAGNTGNAMAGAGDTGVTAGAIEDVGACEASVTTAEIEYRETSALTEQQRQALAVFRGRSAPILVEPNPVSCQGLVEAPSRVEAEELGAFEAKSFTHADPEIRYDLFFFTERQPVDTTIPSAIASRLSPSDDSGSSLQVWAVADTLFVAVTMPLDDPAAAAIVAHYDQLIAGEE